MAKKKTLVERVRDTLQKHPFIVLVGMLVTIAGGMFAIMESWFTRENAIYRKELEHSVRMQIQSLEDERSRVKIAVGDSTNTVISKDFFVDIANLPGAYTVVENRRFAVAPMSDNGGEWKWNLRSEKEILGEVLGSKLGELLPPIMTGDLADIYDAKDIACYESPQVTEIMFGENVMKARARAMFRFMDWKYFSRVAQAAEAYQYSESKKSFDSLLEGIKQIGGGLEFYEDLFTKLDAKKWEKFRAKDDFDFGFMFKNLAESNAGRATTFLNFVETKLSAHDADKFRAELSKVREQLQREKAEEKKRGEEEEQERKAELEKIKKKQPEIDRLGIFLQMFIQIGTQLDGVAPFNVTDYSFQKDMFCIQGYFKLQKLKEPAVEVRLQVVTMGFMTGHGLYFIEFRVPVESNHKDVQRLMTLVKTAKILD